MLYLFFDNKKLFSSFETYILIGFIFIISPVFIKHVKIYFSLIFMLFKYKSYKLNTHSVKQYVLMFLK